MSPIALTLVADGSSDRILLPFISALMDLHCPAPFISQFAEQLPSTAKTLGMRIRAALTLYPCDLLFVHRNAEGQEVDRREGEIRRAIKGIHTCPPLVCVIPVRMTEAWLLTCESTIRRAVGNSNGTSRLNLPSLSQIERLPNPKNVLFGALEAASDLGVRRRHKFRPEHYRHKVAESITDYSAVRKLPSFTHLESQITAFFATPASTPC